VSDLEKIILTSFLTIAGGVFVFIIGQLVQKFFLEPVYEQAKAIGAVLFNLTYYAPWYANPGHGKEDDLSKASNAIRECASHLEATTHAIYCYCLFDALRLAPTRSNIEIAVGNLIFISNSVHSGDGRDNRKHADEVKNLLARGNRHRLTSQRVETACKPPATSER
jgi:hypothetical protein